MMTGRIRKKFIHPFGHLVLVAGVGQRLLIHTQGAILGIDMQMITILGQEGDRNRIGEGKGTGMAKDQFAIYRYKDLKMKSHITRQ
jgi:hypothetical protein